MTECAAMDVRDRLPELLHGTLAAPEAARLRAHLLECDACREEFALLEAARATFATTAPSVDVARVVAALPRPGRASARPADVSTRPARRPSLPPSVTARGRGWHRRPAVVSTLAAALLLGVLGVWGVQSPNGGGLGRGDTLAALPVPRGPVGLSFAGGVGDLPDEALLALLEDLESLEPAPAAEPDLVDWRVSDPDGD